MVYTRSSNTIQLSANGGNGTWVGSATLGTSTTLQNSQCSLTVGSSSQSSSGSVLTLNLRVALKTAFAGNHKVWGNVTDANSNGNVWAQYGTWTVSGNATPTTGTISPSSGTGTSQVFTGNYADTNGGNMIVLTSIAIHPTGGGANCTAYIYPAPQHIYLDDGAQWLGPVSLGSSATVENARCRVGGTASSCTISGNNLSCSVPFVFKAGFSGTMNTVLTATDVANASAYGTAGTWTAGTPDTTPPTISSVAHSSITTNSATITWTTNEPSDTQVDYGTTTSYGSSTTLNTSMVTSHSAALTGLQAGTTYYYRVRSKDAANNLATQAAGPFTTTSGPTPPYVYSFSPSNITNAPANWTGQFQDANGVTTITSTEWRFGTEEAPTCAIRINHTNGTYEGWNSIGLPWDPPKWGPVTALGESSSQGRCNYNPSASATSTTVTSTFFASYNFPQNGPFEFSGPVYMRVTDSGGLSSGWVYIGSWTQEP